MELCTVDLFLFVCVAAFAAWRHKQAERFIVRLKAAPLRKQDQPRGFAMSEAAAIPAKAKKKGIRFDQSEHVVTVDEDLPVSASAANNESLIESIPSGVNDDSHELQHDPKVRTLDDSDLGAFAAIPVLGNPTTGDDDSSSLQSLTDMFKRHNKVHPASTEVQPLDHVADDSESDQPLAGIVFLFVLQIVNLESNTSLSGSALFAKS
jgi:hypothetical protein